MKIEDIAIREVAVTATTPEERVRRAIQDTQERRDTPLNSGFGMELEDFQAPRIVYAIPYADTEEIVIIWPEPRSEAMTAFINRPA